MATPGYRAVFVKEKTHKLLKLLAVKEGKTFDELLRHLLETKKV